MLCSGYDRHPITLHNFTIVKMAHFSHLRNFSAQKSIVMFFQKQRQESFDVMQQFSQKPFKGAFQKGPSPKICRYTESHHPSSTTIMTQNQHGRY